MSVIHKAGPYVAGLQKCDDCGAVLMDDRGVKVPEGTPHTYGFTTGAFIEVTNGRRRVTTEQPTCRETS